jgi:hypothetical protein
MKSHFGKRWRWKLRKFVSVCADNSDELLAAARANPLDRCAFICPRPWSRRLLFVRSLLVRYPDSGLTDLRTAEDHFLSSKKSPLCAQAVGMTAAPGVLSDYEP